MAVAGAVTSGHTCTPRAGSDVPPSGRAGEEAGVESDLIDIVASANREMVSELTDIWRHSSPTEPPKAAPTTIRF